MMQFVTDPGHLDATHDLPVGQGPAVEIHTAISSWRRRAGSKLAT
jgi:hypothetical protein